MESLIFDWVQALVRWLHVIAGIAWIGSSFFFVFLDASLRKEAWTKDGIMGESWLVHGGGFYLVEKYMVAPERMPKVLHWFKWEAYTTWLSGFALLVLLYYMSADVYLIDPSVADLSQMTAIVIGVGSLVFGWIIYDLICRGMPDQLDALSAIGFVLLALVAFGYTQVFGGRGAFIHVGALIGTIMAANVFMIIIPNQRKVVKALVAGENPDPNLGKVAKQRSLHNNYLTLPVVFIMVSNHYSVIYGHHLNWLILIGIGVVGGLIRHYFNVKHGTGKSLMWTWVAAAAGVVIIFLISAIPRGSDIEVGEVTMEDVRSIVSLRCAECHAAQPANPAFAAPPAGVVFDTPEDIVANAERIHAQVISNVMPPGNLTELTPEERAMLVQWAAGVE